MSDVIHELGLLRNRLLDLTLRNRLLSYRESKARTIRIVDERPEELYDILVFQKKAMEFLAGTSPTEGDQSDSDLFETSDDPILWALPPEDAGIAAHHQDRFLQTPYEPESLQKRLFYADKKSTEALEEQGYTVLFLALGYLEWYESDSSEVARVAPLILVPVELKRASAVKPYRLTWSGEEIQFNISLREKLIPLGIELPALEPDEITDKRQFLDYLNVVTQFIKKKERWRVLNSVYLDFFAFSKFVMYKDLDPEHWPAGHKPWDHPVIQALLAPRCDPESIAVFDEKKVDVDIPLADFYSVLDCDPSQTAVVETIKAGTNLVMEGPPGTGKSQTITNLIAELLATGKSVLFVSEKMAALEVVKRRIDEVGLGDFCVELHSRKANKGIFIKELERTLKLTPSVANPDTASHVSQLEATRNQLNAYATALRTPFGAIAYSPFVMIGNLERTKKALTALGDGRASVPLTGVRTVDRTEFNRILGLLRSIDTLTPEIGGVHGNPWSHCRLKQAFPIDIDRIRGEIEAARAHLSNLLASLHQITVSTNVWTPAHLADVRTFWRVLETCTKCPADAPETTSRVTPGDLVRGQERCLAALQSFCQAKEKLSYPFNSRHYGENYEPLATEFRRRAAGMLRWLSPRYHSLKREALEMYEGAGKRSPHEIVTDLDSLLAVQQTLRNLRELDTLGTRVFGLVWRGNNSSLAELTEYAQWSRAYVELASAGYVSHPWPTQLSTQEQRSHLRQEGKRATKLARDFSPLLQQVFSSLQADLHRQFARNANEVSFTQLAELLEAWAASLQYLQRWSQYNLLREEALATIAKPIMEALEQGKLPETGISHAFEFSFYDTLIREAFGDRPALGTFMGVQQEKLIEQFRDLDSSLLALNKTRLRRMLYESRPIISPGAAAGSEVGILLAQFNKQKGHLPIRKLMSLAGGLIQKIKPCFMMSPLSVAQFLDPRTTRFDIVVFDEASQVRPEDAIGPIIRGRQLVVAGDTRQLPPTSFFDTVIESGEDDGDGKVAAVEVESVLNQCRRAFPVRDLKWHYRSRHESLIAVSNSAFYDNRLLIYPAPYRDTSRLGLSFVHLPDTVYDRGKSSCNRQEAKAVALAAISHLRTNPHQTLGVGTFSVAQQHAILEELELLFRENPEIEQLTYNDKGENLFVKNLETIQGDERDVILLSIGYGRDFHGKLSTNFGPLNNEGGERRLNVLITRARLKCVVYSNFRGDDLRIGSDAPFGVRALKTYLKYAETGNLPELESVRADTESPFEQSVYDFLRSEGFEVAKQVGCASYRIDLAVVDPGSPGRYLLGVECDGAMYHSSSVARERDRLRHQVLENLGWKGRLHRIWSTDWYRDAPGAKMRLLDAIDRARALKESGSGVNHSITEPPGYVKNRDNNGTETGTAAGTPPVDSATVLRSALMDSSELLLGIATDYLECESIQHSARKYDLAEAPEKAVLDAVCDVVKVESPIHEEELIRRVRSLWGYARAGSRIQARVKQGIRLASAQGRIESRGDFLYCPAQSGIRIRRRTNGRIDYIPDEELDAAIVEVLRRQYSTPESGLVTAVARVLGFERTGKAIESRLSARITELTSRRTLTRSANGAIELS